MRRSAAILLLLACGACASPGGLRDGADGRAVLDQMSDKSSQQIAGCIGDRIEVESGKTFSAFAGTDFSTRPTATGYSISGVQHLTVGSDTIVLIDIAGMGHGSEVRVYTHFLIGNGPPQLFTAIKDCT